MLCSVSPRKGVLLERHQQYMEQLLYNCSVLQTCGLAENTMIAKIRRF